MKKTVSRQKQASRFVAFATTLVVLCANTSAIAGDDPSIKGDLRGNIKESMNQFIKNQTIDNVLFVYDSVEGKLHKLKFDALHNGIVEKNGFYVSCADFKDQNGRKFDIDFLVRPSGSKLITTQALVHSVDGKKRKYHLETM